jgi:putative FmdB family regulatory protein
LPLYEYQCAKCERRVEKIQKFSDPPLTTCEHCGGKLERLISSPAIQFKGSGWYVTDYARGSSASGSKSSSTDSSDGDSKKAEDSSKKSEATATSPGKTGGPAKSGSSEPARTKSSKD